MKKISLSQGLFAAGTLTVILYGILAWLSWESVTSPDLSVFLFVWAGVWGATLAAWLLTVRSVRKDRTLTIPFKSIWLWAILFRLVGLAALPVYEDDFYRFLWDGWRFSSTGNPYSAAPATFFEDPDVPPHMGAILENVNYPQVPTIYGPICQWAFLAAYLIGGSSLIGLKLVFLAADLLALFLMQRLCSRRHFVLYAWCPLLILETAFNAHPDILGVGLLLGAFVALGQKRSLLAASLGALAMGVKVLALPAVAVILHLGSNRFKAIGIFMLTLALVYAPFLLQGTLAEWKGLRVFAEYWEFNSSFVGLLQWAGLAFIPAKLIGIGLWGTVFIGLWVQWLRQGSGKAVLPLDIAYGVLFLCSPVVNAWYLLWMLPFVVLRPRIWSVVALMVVSLSYITGQNLGDPHLAAFRHPVWLRPLEYGLVGIAILIDWRLTAKKDTPSHCRSLLSHR